MYAFASSSNLTEFEIMHSRLENTQLGHNTTKGIEIKLTNDCTIKLHIYNNKILK